MKKNVVLLLSVFLVLLSSFQFSLSQVEAASEPSLSYSVNVESKGWLPASKNGEIAGTTGKGLGIKGFSVSVTNSPYSGGIEYEAATTLGYSLRLDALYIRGFGRGMLAGNGDVVEGYQSNQILEAFNIYLTGEIANHYEVYARAHISYFSWLNWAKADGTNFFGSIGLGKKLEAIQLSLIKKGNKTPPTGDRSYLSLPIIDYKHYTKTKWSSVAHSNDEIVTGLSNEFDQEGIVLDVKHPYGPRGNFLFPTLTGKIGVRYRSYVQGVGWQSWVNDGQVSGLIGKQKSQEAIQIELTGGIERHVDIYYQSYIDGMGWQSWVKNGEVSGEIGKNKSIKSYRIYLVYKNGPTTWFNSAY